MCVEGGSACWAVKRVGCACYSATVSLLHTQFWDASAGPLKASFTSWFHVRLATRGRLQSWGREGACSLVPASCWLWSLVSPSNTASLWQQQFLPVHQLNQVCHFSSVHRTILITVPLRDTITNHPALTPQRSGFQLWGAPPLRFKPLLLRFNNTISTHGPLLPGANTSMICKCSLLTFSVPYLTILYLTTTLYISFSLLK